MKAVKSVLVLAVMVGLAGCQSTPKTSQEQTSPTNSVATSDKTQVAFGGLKATQAKWAEALKDADALSIYAPENYRDMQQAWQKASKIFTRISKDPQLINEDYSLFSSDTYLQVYQDQINQVSTQYSALIKLKTNADTVLADAIAQQEYLDELNAKTQFPSAYKSLYTQYQGLFNYVMLNELENAQSAQVDYLNQAHELEIKLVKRQYIEPLRKELVTLKGDDFERVAPLTYANAQSEVNLADTTAMANPRNKKLINEAVSKARFAIGHLKQVAHQVKMLASVRDSKFESAVLEIENKLLAISQAVNGHDYRDLMIREQGEKILADVNQLHSQDRTAELKVTVKQLQEQLQSAQTAEKDAQKAQTKSELRESSLLAQIKRQEGDINNLTQQLSVLKAQLAQKQAAQKANSLPASQAATDGTQPANEAASSDAAAGAETKQVPAETQPVVTAQPAATSQDN